MDHFPTGISREWAAALFDECPVPLAVVAADHRFSRCNDAYCGLVGYARAELLARTWQSITHPDDVAGDQDGADRARGDEERNHYAVVKRYLTKSGTVAWVNLHVRAVFEEGRFTCYFIVAIPIASPSAAGDGLKPKTTGFVEWAKKNPRDSLILALAAGLFIGRDELIELLKLWLK